MRKIGTAALVLVALATLSACTPSSDDEPTPTPVSTSGPIFPTVDPSTLNPPPTGAIDADTGEPYAPQTVAVWDDESRASVIAAAETAMTAYARPDLPFDQWWAAVQPLLDQKASQDYAYMEPSRIAAKQLTGPGVIVDDTSAYVATVEVPTNAGTYGLILSRVDGKAPWFVSRFILPEGVN
uniref:hypothetical protein n=1 Tax=Cryobacterium sp. TaxID=1926290 RepID=UPI00159A9BB9|nr:hypothetical protein [Cryobacterium sp.]QJS06037.1 hypothetical protein [Cryobacterium sp.]